MFSALLGPPIYDFVEQGMGEHVVVHATRKPRMCKDLKVRLRIEGKLYPYTVFFVWIRPFPGGGFVVGARLVNPTDLPEQKTDPKASGRKSWRIQGRFRVTSRELPNFAGMTLDVSSGGMMLQVQAPLHEGKVLNLRVETGDDNPLEFQGTVRWCRQEGKNYVVGVQLLGVRDEQRERLEQLSRDLAWDQQSSIQKRMLGR